MPNKNQIAALGNLAVQILVVTDGGNAVPARPLRFQLDAVLTGKVIRRGGKIIAAQGYVNGHTDKVMFPVESVYRAGVALETIVERG